LVKIVTNQNCVHEEMQRGQTYLATDIVFKNGSSTS